MKKIKFVLSLLLLSIIAFGAVSAENDPQMQVQLTIDKIVKIVNSNPGDNNKAERRKQMRSVIDERFNFEEMAKRSLGIYWKKATPEEQAQYVDSFSSLLMQTYMEKLEGVKPGMVNIKDKKIKEDKSLVKTIATINKDSFPIDYKLMYSAGNWTVYDVVIENISLVANYRSEFAGIIRKDKMSGLLSKLKEKVANL